MSNASTQTQHRRQALDEILTGSFAPFARHLVFSASDAGDPGPVVRSVELLAPHHLESICRQFRQEHGPTDARVVASVWSMWHFGVVMPACLIPAVLLGWDLGPAIRSADFVLNEAGRTRSLRVSADLIASHTAGAKPTLDFHPLVDHLEATVDALHRQTNVTRRVLWNNAGNLFESFVRRMELVRPRDPEVAARILQCDQWLRRLQLADGRDNPLHEPVVYITGATGGVNRQRRICCMRYRVPDGLFCGTCPSPLMRQGTAE